MEKRDRKWNRKIYKVIMAKTFPNLVKTSTCTS